METKKCSECGTCFQKPYGESYKQWNNRKYCSRKCASISRIGEPPINKGIKWGKGGPKKGIPNLKIRGDKHWNWRGSDKYLRIKISNSLEYKCWRKDIMIRDNFTCSLCGKAFIKGGGAVKFHVDHIVPFAEIISKYSIDTVTKALKTDELFDRSNGRLLCIECHRHTDTYGGSSAKRTRSGVQNHRTAVVEII